MFKKTDVADDYVPSGVAGCCTTVVLVPFEGVRVWITGGVCTARVQEPL